MWKKLVAEKYCIKQSWADFLTAEIPSVFNFQKHFSKYEKIYVPYLYLFDHGTQEHSLWNTILGIDWNIKITRILPVIWDNHLSVLSRPYGSVNSTEHSEIRLSNDYLVISQDNPFCFYEALIPEVLLYIVFL